MSLSRGCPSAHTGELCSCFGATPRFLFAQFGLECIVQFAGMLLADLSIHVNEHGKFLGAQPATIRTVMYVLS